MHNFYTSMIREIHPKVCFRTFFTLFHVNLNPGYCTCWVNLIDWSIYLNSEITLDKINFMFSCFCVEVCGFVCVVCVCVCVLGVCGGVCWGVSGGVREWVCGCVDVVVCVFEYGGVGVWFCIRVKRGESLSWRNSLIMLV